MSAHLNVAYKNTLLLFFEGGQGQSLTFVFVVTVGRQGPAVKDRSIVDIAWKKHTHIFIYILGQLYFVLPGTMILAGMFAHWVWADSPL